MSVENCGELSTVVEDTPTICWVCNLSGVPYIVVISLSKKLVASLLTRFQSSVKVRRVEGIRKEEKRSWKLRL